MKFFIFLFSCWITTFAYGQADYTITPQPVFVTKQKGDFILNATTKVFGNQETESTVNFLNDYLQKYYGFKVSFSPISYSREDQVYPSNSICFLAHSYPSQVKEAYTLNIRPNNILIEGNPAGMFYAVQSIIQLLPIDSSSKKITLPAVSIGDQPRFAYRGMHLDAARHFWNVNQIKQYIDYLAMFKFNTFHWHLTDDQGWRIEIKKHPKLTETGSCREQTLIGPYGTGQYDHEKYCGYYTQDEIKEIVKYAQDRFINIIPEIEMPGHAMAALTSYPNLGCTGGPYKVMETWGVSDDVFCAGNDSSFLLLQNVLDEVIQLFPSEYIHIGGDECPKDRWKICKKCQKRKNELGLKDEHELQSYFINRIEKYLNSQGRKIIGWDEILEGGLAPNATVMSWRGEEGGIAAARQQHNAIMTPGNPLYFDHAQSIHEDSLTQGGLNTLKDVYDYEPIPSVLKENERKYILGAQANMWTEYMTNWSKVEYMLFPRISALSEVLWAAKENKNWKRFEENLPNLFNRCKQMGIHYSKAYYDLQTKMEVAHLQKNNPTSEIIGVNWLVESPDKKGRIFITRPYFDTTNEYAGKVAVPIIQDGKYTATLMDSSGHFIGSPISQDFHINKATGKSIQLKFPPSNNYSVGGVLTLVDGIQNTKGMSKSAEFLGFEGTDLEAVVDFERPITMETIILHAFKQQASWIYPPSEVICYVSNDGVNFKEMGKMTTKDAAGHLIYTFNTKFIDRYNTKPIYRYLKISATNFGRIPDGLPGGGNKAWLFVDEIEVY